MFKREKLGAAAQEIADHLQLIENVKTLQSEQKSLADGLAALGERIRDLELEMRGLKSETKLEALKEAQGVVFSVQGSLNQRIENLAVKIEGLRSNGTSPQLLDGQRTTSDNLEIALPQIEKSDSKNSDQK